MEPSTSNPSEDRAVHDREYRIEVIRKAIHLCSISIPIVYYLTSRQLALAILIPLTTFCIIADLTRYYSRSFGKFFYGVFGMLLRQHERNDRKKTLNGATYVLIAASLCILVFPKIIAVTAFLILIVSDMTSALVGKRFGRHRFFGKSLEGSVAFFLSAAVVILVTPKISYVTGEYVIGVTAAALGALVEALPLGIDDNITIPLLVGAALWAAYALWLPGLNLQQLG
ncbi:MAG TPA: SEC59/DGK1/VTE5 family protein [Bacteroidota bacterium]|nr:SEC59/DGK1/VTE5 family protein [Bacteroidota bacterium]